MKGKHILSIRLATIATIHTAHGFNKNTEKKNAQWRLTRELPVVGRPLKSLQLESQEEDKKLSEEVWRNIKQANSEWTGVKVLTQEICSFTVVKNGRHRKRRKRARHCKKGG